MVTRHAVRPGALIRITTVSGDITVVAEDRHDIEVEPRGRRIKSDDEGNVRIRSTSTDLLVRCPADSNVSVGSFSGDVSLQGEFGSAKVNTFSGHIDIDSIERELDVRSLSGDVSVRSCTGPCKVNSKSGHISIGRASAAASVYSISGRVNIGTAGRDDVEVKTISGGVNVHVAGGRAPALRLRSTSGRITSACAEGSDFELKASTVSGSIQVEGA